MDNGKNTPTAAPPTAELSTRDWDSAFANYLDRRDAVLASPSASPDDDDAAASAASAAEARLILDVPAPDAAALLIKLRVACRASEHLKLNEKHVDAIAADVRRLFPEEVGHGA